MAEVWYVPAMVEFERHTVGGSHVIVAGVPDDVYSLPDAWFQEELKLGVWKLTFKEHISLTDDQRNRMRLMGGRPEVEGPIDVKALEDRRAKKREPL